MCVVSVLTGVAATTDYGAASFPITVTALTPLKKNWDVRTLVHRCYKKVAKAKNRMYSFHN